MTTQPQNEYLLLFRGTHWDKDLSPEEIQTMVTKWYAWFEGLIQQGKCKGGQPLKDEGKIVTGKAGRVADGPFAESKEAIGGYFLLQVNGIDEAVAIAKQCPGLAYGIDVEVRPVAEQCAAKARLEEAQTGQLAGRM
jgi:hypothetical protein